MIKLIDTKNRWREAQKFEYNDWANIPNIIDKEWKEIEKKYKSYIKHLSIKLKINKTSKILDVGCGPTCISRLFIKGEKYGIDPLAGILKLDQRIKEVKIIDARGEEIPFENNFFDLVICRNVIDHTERPEEVISEIGRVLKNEGFFILCCYVYSPFIKVVKEISEFIPSLRNAGHPHTFSPKTLEKLLESAGVFKIIERKDIYTGFHPNDYGKIDEKCGEFSFLQKLVLFLNFKILRQKWFVKEYCLVARKNVKIK